MTVAYVGLGANIGEPRRQLQEALQHLDELAQTRVTGISGFYRSAPMGYLDQPEFLNAVARLDTTLSAEQLLENLQKLEQQQNRERSFPNAPRTLDLDLLLFGDSVLDSPRLTLPHPRMHERAFVLKPLAEIAPQAIIPGRGTASELLEACRDQHAERLD